MELSMPSNYVRICECGSITEPLKVDEYIRLVGNFIYLCSKKCVDKSQYNDSEKATAQEFQNGYIIKLNDF